MTTTTAQRHPFSLLLSLVLAAGLALAAVLVAAPPAQAAVVTGTIDGISYDADDTNVAAGARVTGYLTSGPMGLDPVIPASVTLGGTVYAVTRIGFQAFDGKGLTSVEIPNSVTSIAISAFSYNALASVTLPSTLTSMGQGAFAHNALSSLTVPASLTTIPDTAFATNPLTSVTFPNTLTSIGQGAFEFNHQLVSVTIPASVTSIASGAFASTSALTTVIFEGDAPSITAAGSSGSFEGASGKTLYYSSGATGFTTPTWEGYNTAVSAAPTITSGAFPAAEQFVPFSYTMTASGSPAPTLSMTGLPDGLSFDPATGTVSGSPLESGTFAVTMTASNGVAPDAVVAQNLNVTGAIFITSLAPPNGTVGTPYSYTLTGTGPGTLTWTVGALTPLPPTLTLGSSDGLLSGMPNAAGSYSVRIWVDNGGVSQPAFANYTIVIAAQTHTVTFESHGGSAVADQTVTDGDPATEPAVPTRSGYTFTGWFTSASLTALYDFSAPVTGDLTLYAGWEVAATSPADPEEQIPSTGAEISSGPLLAAVLGLVGGVALMLRRRCA